MCLHVCTLTSHHAVQLHYIDVEVGSGSVRPSVRMRMIGERTRLEADHRKENQRHGTPSASCNTESTAQMWDAKTQPSGRQRLEKHQILYLLRRPSRLPCPPYPVLCFLNGRFGITLDVSISDWIG